MKYKVWFSIDQAWEVEAKSKEEAQEMVEGGGHSSDKDIVEQRNWEFIEAEELLKD